MEDIHDIKALSPVLLPMSLTKIGVIALVVALVLAAAILGWLFWQRRKKPFNPEAQKPPPDEIAYQRLQLLDKTKDITDKAYYISLSSIFREYVEGRYGIDGLEMTTEELLPQLDKIDIDKVLRQEAKAFVAACDPVKFADGSVTADKRAVDFKLVKTFVEKTTVEEEELRQETESGN